MINIKDPLVQLKITSATCSFFAIASTLYRLWLRRSRLWVDDLAAAFALLTLVIQIVSVFLHLPVPNSQSQTTRVAVYYTMAYAFYTVIFFSRLSILFSIIRIDSSQRRRRYLHGAAIFIVAALLFLMAQLLWVCEPEPSWKLAANPQCKLPLQVAVCQLVTDVIIDGILLAAPLTLLRHLADKRLRRKLTVIFSTCVATTIVSLVHAAYILSKGGIKVLISALVEDTCSLIVANLPVLIGATFRITGDDDRVQTVDSTQMRFTRVNLTSDFKATSTAGITTTDSHGHLVTIGAQTKTNGSELGLSEGSTERGHSTTMLGVEGGSAGTTTPTINRETKSLPMGIA